MQLIQIVHQAGWIPPGTDQDALSREMRRTVGPMVSKPMDQLDFAGILIQVMDIARRFPFGNSTTIDVATQNIGTCRRLRNRSLPSTRYLETGKADFDRMGQSQYESCQKYQRNWTTNSRFIIRCSRLTNLLIDSLNGLKNQSAWQIATSEIQQMRLQMQQQQQRSWMFGSIILILLTIAIISPWFISIILIAMTALLRFGVLLNNWY
jgi:ubiquinone biosynthesis protein